MSKEISDSAGAVKESTDEAQGIIEEILSGRVKNPWALISAGLAVILALFHVWTSYAGSLEAWRQRSTHLVMILLVFFATEMSRKRSRMAKTVTLTFVVLTLAAGVYVLTNYQAIILREGNSNWNDTVVGTILVIAVLYASQRALGWGITAVASFFIFYCFAGPIFPGALYHRALGFRYVIDQMFTGTNGLMGMPIGISATYIMMFVIFGAFLAKSGGGQFIIDLAFTLTRRVTGGPAMSAVVASAFFGTISGSASANVVGTGTFTIPLMKKVGYKPEFAAAVEAAASTGGMIMPPIMASTAFLIAEFTRTPYVMVMKHALVPALLYFFSIGVAVYIYAKRTGIGAPLKDYKGISALESLKTKGYFLLGVAALVYLLVEGQSPMKAAVYATAFLVLLSFIKSETRMGPGKILRALEDGVRNGMSVAIACGAAGIIVGAINITGVGLSISSLIIQLGGGLLPLVLLLAAIMALILGMGMTAAAVYIIVVALLVPALIEMNVNIMASHFFAFYFSIISNVTPPVALAAYAAAGLAQANQTRTGIIASRLAMVGLTVPFAFAYDPRILLIGPTLPVLATVVKMFISITFLNIGVDGFFTTRVSGLQRLAVLAGAIMMMAPLSWVPAAGLALCVGGMVVNRARRAQKQEAVA